MKPRKKRMIITALTISLFFIITLVSAQESHCIRSGQEKSNMGMQQMMKNKDGMMRGKGMGVMSAMHDPAIMVLRHFGNGNLFKNSAQDLNLTNDQIEKLEAIWLQNSKSAIQHKADLDVVKLELQNILNDNSYNGKQAKALISKIGSVQESIRMEYLQSIEKSRKILTDQQLTKLKELPKTNMMHRKMNCTMEGMQANPDVDKMGKHNQ